jgi:hypothetical protein
MAMKITHIEHLLLLLVSSVFGQGNQNFDLNAHCAGKDLQILDHPTDCSSFVVCFRPTPSVFTCPSGYVYHPTLFTCVFSHQCRGQSLEQVLCKNNPGKTLVNPTNCLQYVDCSQSVPVIRTCGSGEIFSMTYGRCLRGNQNTCSLIQVSADICHGQPTNTRMAHPFLDEKYIICTAGGVQIRECDTGNVFDSRTGQCVIGRSVCERRMCRNPGQLLANPLNCRQYFNCSLRPLQVQDCPSGQIFNAVTSSCIAGDATVCPMINDNLEYLCIGQLEGQTFVHPTDCTKSVSCSTDCTLEVNSCPPEYIFDVRQMRCVLGNSETCEVIEHDANDQKEAI